MKGRVSLLIADHAATRLGIGMALGEEVEICAEADNTAQAIRAAKREQPDICLVGHPRGGGGLATVRGICRAAPQAAVVLLAHDPDPDDLLEAVRAGAVGYVPGALDVERLRTVIRSLVANEAVIPRSMVLELLLEVRGRGTLSSRESQVLALLRRGHSTADIAQRLSIAPATVRRHISELVHKLGVNDRAELMDGPDRGGSSAQRYASGITR